jgi:hypothetical protein
MLILATSVFAYEKIPNDTAIWQRNMEKFGVFEKKALSAVNDQTSGASKEKWLASIKDPGLVNWNKCLKLAEDSRKLNIPDDWKTRTEN